MLVTCWSVKGGSGTTVVAAALALTFSHLAPSGALLVDLAGDAPAALGAADPPGPGVAEWLNAPADVDAAALESISTTVTDRLRLLRHGEAQIEPAARWDALARTLSSRPGVTVVDAGLAPVNRSLLAASDESLLVIRPCYLALKRAVRSDAHPSGVVVVQEPGRALSVTDVESVLKAPVRAVVGLDPVIARAVDAGLLAAALPYTLSEALRGAA